MAIAPAKNEPLTLVTSKEEGEQVVLFSIDGVDFSVPNKVRANVMLRYLHEVRQVGEVSANAWLLEELLGDEAHQALMTFDDLTSEQLSQVQTIAAKIVLGDTEDSKDPQGNDTTRK